MTSTQTPVSAHLVEPEGRIRYGVAVSTLMAAAFVLSAVHTIYAELSGLEDPGFTVTTPTTWVFYLAGFAMAALARHEARAAQASVTAYLVAILAVSVFYYPTTFTLEQQTTFGWFENDVYTGLLLTSLILSVLRLRRRALVP
jgi:hypothetical protein